MHRKAEHVAIGITFTRCLTVDFTAVSPQPSSTKTNDPTVSHNLPRAKPQGRLLLFHQRGRLLGERDARRQLQNANVTEMDFRPFRL